MNTVQVVRADVEGAGIRLRIWVDDDRGHHVCVAEMRLGYKTLVAWGNEILTAERDAEQQQLPFDD